MDKNNKKKKMTKLESRTFDYGTHPGAYTTDYDRNNELLDTINSADDIFKYNIRQPIRNANPASPSVPDPAVPNRAHTEM